MKKPKLIKCVICGKPFKKEGIKKTCSNKCSHEYSAKQSKAYREKNKDKIAKQIKAYKEKNKDKIVKQHKVYWRKKKQHQKEHPEEYLNVLGKKVYLNGKIIHNSYIK